MCDSENVTYLLNKSCACDEEYLNKHHRSYFLVPKFPLRQGSVHKSSGLCYNSVLFCLIPSSHFSFTISLIRKIFEKLSASCTFSQVWWRTFTTGYYVCGYFVQGYFFRTPVTDSSRRVNAKENFDLFFCNTNNIIQSEQ